jgi:hypothetical protein
MKRRLNDTNLKYGVIWQKYFALLPFLFCFVFSAGIENSYGQTELQAWGNITGIRVQGELMGFETSLRAVGNKWSSITATGKEAQSPKFNRDILGRQVVNTRLGGISFTEMVTDLLEGEASIVIQFTSARDTTGTSLFFCISLPLSDYGQGTISLDKMKPFLISGIKTDSSGEWMKTTSAKIRISSVLRQMDIRLQEADEVIIHQVSERNDQKLEIYLPIQSGNLSAGQSGQKTYIIKTTGHIDKRDIHMVMDTSRPGREFAGLGGNFRIQNLKTDPEVIEYCLNNMRVAWGRVEMPWRFWQPEKNVDPVTAAKSGKLDVHVQRAMDMAQKLQQRGIPIILTAWSAPDWAIIGKARFIHQPGEPWGNPLNPDSLMFIYQSIADYIQYLQDQFDVQISFFSFNESDLGIYVRQTGEQHDDLIKGLGKYFLSRGLKTKILLGDNSDATTYTFIEPALHDISAHPYIGAVSFHSWRGWETGLLSQWATASREINLPLIVGEGSIDAAAWGYPAIFLEQTYAMQEINLYVRFMAVCQPLSILQWQLTSDYSPLTGGGIFGKDGPLEPTRRFWNLKQLASTPAGLNYLPVVCDRPTVTCAAVGNGGKGKYILHIVNNGAERKVILRGIPSIVHSFKIFSTGKTLSMQEGHAVNVHNNEMIFMLPSGCFTTLTSE